MNRFYLILAAFVMSGCYPGALLEESVRSGVEAAPAIPGLIANPANPTSWFSVIAAVSAIVAAGCFGPAAARKVRAFFGKRP